MAQHDLIADSLNKAKRQARDGILRSPDLSATDRTRLIRGGWLKRIVRGYYVLGAPGREGESGIWHGHDFRRFARLYLADRFGRRYCLSARIQSRFTSTNPLSPDKWWSTPEISRRKSTFRSSPGVSGDPRLSARRR